MTYKEWLDGSMSLITYYPSIGGGFSDLVAYLVYPSMYAVPPARPHEPKAGHSIQRMAQEKQPLFRAAVSSVLLKKGTPEGRIFRSLRYNHIFTTFAT